MPETAPMALDDSVEEIENVPAKDNDGIPYCRVHHCRMKYSSGGKKNSPTAYYSCPVPKCDEKQQIIKTANVGVVPPQPQPCPRCSRDKKPVYCERDAHASTAASVVLKCPDCGWKSNAMVVPQLAAALAARKPSIAVENIGDR